MARVKRNRNRRGVLLLVIMGLLAMFGLVAIAFVVLSSQADRAAKTAARVDQYAEDPERDIHRAAMQVFKGPSNQTSVIGPHSLLEDVYGNDPNATASYSLSSGETPIALAGAQLIEFSVSGVTDPARYVGNVLTMLDGPAKGQSTRVVRYLGRRQNWVKGVSAPVSAQDTFQILAFEGTTADSATNAALVDGQALQGTYILNGAAFAGSGFGLNTGASALSGPILTHDDSGSDQPTGLPYALLPNPIANAGDVSYSDPAGPGGANEDYDAPDYQNMILAAIQPDGQVPIPSLHRPSLVNYLVSQLNGNGQFRDAADPWHHFYQVYGSDLRRGTGDDSGTNLANTDLAYWTKRKAILRPLIEDHPDFTGSNPASANNDFYLYGPWDVDNDGDGQPDSIWVDLGFPARTSPDGRTYKPLFAVLCTDLDGRLNLNAHGTLAQTESGYYTNTDVTTTQPLAGANGNNRFADVFDVANGNPGANKTLAALFRGNGYGPAEVNLRALFEYPDNAGTPTSLNLDYGANQPYWRLMCGNFSGTTPVEGRYGEPREWTASSRAPQPGATVSGGTRLRDDLPLWNRYTDYPYNYWGRSSFMTPSDLHGMTTLGLDVRGLPLYAALNGQWGQIRINHPYEIDLEKSAQRYHAGSGVYGGLDSPFTVYELERLMRPFDQDSPSLPNRILQLTAASNLTSLAGRRHEVTTASWSISTPGGAVPPDHSPQTKYAFPGAHFATYAGATPGQLEQLYPLELLAGQKMDLNRPFGNGLDGNGLDDDGDGSVDFPMDLDLNGDGSNEISAETAGMNGIVDEPEEAHYTDSSGNEHHEMVTVRDVNGAPVAVSMDHNNDGAFDFNDCQVRQLYARHLYVLLKRTVDVDALRDHLGVSDVDRVLAQYAVNVVDFRDADSIMTAFEYDPNPFDGWDVNGDPADDEIDTSQPESVHVVWGCERPELLITETFAYHDRRTEDTNQDDGIGTDTKDTLNPDPDFDQKEGPEASLFVELYCPSSAQQLLPAEFYNVSGDLRLDLGRKVGGTGSPIWRMIVVVADKAKDPDAPNPNDRAEHERSVYFTNVATPPVDGNEGTDHENFTATASTGGISPGGYAVIGPAHDANGISYIGSRSGPVRDTDTRQIVLDTTDADEPFRVEKNGSVYNVAADSTYINYASSTASDRNAAKPAVVVVNSPRPLSVSDDKNYKPIPHPTSGQCYDEPFDKGTVWMEDSTHENYCVIHLQRLANPLENFHATRNPYRTVDSLPVHVTSFNGLETGETAPVVDGESPPHFVSKERGDAMRTKPATDALRQSWQWHDGWARPLWMTEPLNVASRNSKAGTDAGHIFADHIDHSLGALNQTYTDANQIATAGAMSLWFADGNTQYVGSPSLPFPWLTWLNRPFASETELLLVPGERSSRLFSRFTLMPHPTDTGTGGLYCYKPANQTSTKVQEPFYHLWNFFHSDRANSHGSGAGPELHRLLAFVGVPSRYAGTSMMGYPVAFSQANGSAYGTHAFHLPFNWFSHYREPGRINLNTVYSADVFRGLMNRFPYDAFPNMWADLSPVRGEDGANRDLVFWERFVRSRRNVSASDWVVNQAWNGTNSKDPVNPDLASISNDILRRAPFEQAIEREIFRINPGELNGSTWEWVPAPLPTEFAQPYRSFAGNYLVPLAELAPEREVNSTLLRQVPNEVPNSQTHAVALEPYDEHRALFEFTSWDPSTNTQLNPYFRYQELSRVAQSVTSQSNVYAVWITVGYFEVTPVNPADFGLTAVDPARWPDGYQLGQEMGIDTGDVKRHRAFYIFDRSIPVGFRRGEDLNVEKAILLKRFIE